MIEVCDLKEEVALNENGDGIVWKKDAYCGFKKSVLAHSAGSAAGCVRRDGRRVVRIKSRVYLEYRVIWALFKGTWPLGEIDHINGISSDNRIDNLRDCSRRTNQENRRVAQLTKTTSQFLGVYLDKRKKYKRWRSSIGVDGVQKSLGYFLTEQEASNAYVAAKRLLHDGCTL
jgi:hypothetical protein